MFYLSLATANMGDAAAAREWWNRGRSYIEGYEGFAYLEDLCPLRDEARRRLEALAGAPQCDPHPATHSVVKVCCNEQ